MRPQHACPPLLGKELPAGALHRCGKHQILEPALRHEVVEQILGRMALGRLARRPLTHAVANHLIEPLGQHRVLLAALLGNNRLGHGARTLGVAGDAGLHEVHEEIGACHGSSPFDRATPLGEQRTRSAAGRRQKRTDSRQAAEADGSRNVWPQAKAIWFRARVLGA